MKIFSTLTIIAAVFFSATALEISDFKNGAVALTFDDSWGENWVKAIPLFEKYNARATFFFTGAITPQYIKAMKTLQRHGHSVGLHSLHHKNALPAIAESGAGAYIAAEITPQLEVCRANGIDVRYFAYPNNRRSDETDRALSGIFKRFRAGAGQKKRGYRIADAEKTFIPVADIPATVNFGGHGIGEYYLTTTGNLDEALEKAARENKLIVFFSHDISPDANKISMPTHLLEYILKKASALNMKIIGFDELPE